MKMPWVFLHAIKDYYDMPWLLSRYPPLKATFNLSASLIEQLKLYLEPTKYDVFLKLWILPPSLLDDDQKQWMIKLMGAMPFETMVRPIRRYAELYAQADLSDEELNDLEVAFILAWCGNYLRWNHRTVQELLIKERGYTQSDKEMLLESLSAFVAKILPFYGELQREGKISVATTPYFHPILPLLIDMQNALIANPESRLPDGAFSLEEDAQEHIRRAIELYTETFGCRPKGFWPSEGGVDEKSIALYRREGIEWIATDEAVVYESLKSKDERLKYDLYDFQGVCIGFRDHALSDLIGFEYAHRSAYDAGGHFMNQLKRIAENHDDPTVLVVVDGENAWEFYPNNGVDFFEELYGQLSEAKWCQTMTMDEAAQRSRKMVLDRLAPGTWIHGTFDTWVGNTHKNRAWELLFRTHRDVMERMQNIDDGVREKIRYHLLASECSDWFWWYGEDHTSDFAREFDELFRGHLIDVYRLLELSIPETLFEPIVNGVKQRGCWEKPAHRISPKIDGSPMRVLEWAGCGRIDERRCFSTMERGRGDIDIIYYGYDDDALYFRMEGKIDPSGSISIQAEIEELKEPIQLMANLSAMSIETMLKRERIAENSILHIRLVLLSEGKEIQRLPGWGYLPIDLNDRFSEHWFV